MWLSRHRKLPYIIWETPKTMDNFILYVFSQAILFFAIDHTCVKNSNFNQGYRHAKKQQNLTWFIAFGRCNFCMSQSYHYPLCCREDVLSMIRRLRLHKLKDRCSSVLSDSKMNVGKANGYGIVPFLTLHTLLSTQSDKIRDSSKRNFKRCHM